jgi:hypothetical protein
MGILDFFKKKQPSEKEKINLEELRSFLSDKKKSIKKRHDVFLDLIEQKKSLVIQDLEKNISVLEKIDLKDKKVEDRIKLIVMENLGYYINNLKKLTENLKETEKSGDIIEELNKLFFNFEKRSNMNFQKATFLIGREMEAVKNIINNFFDYLKKTIGDNRELIEEMKILSFADSKAEELKKIEETKKEITQIINRINKEISQLKELLKETEKSLEKSKKSKELEEETQKEKELKEKQQALNIQILKLKEYLDFKSLASVFHSNEKKMKIIKSLQDNFIESVERDNGESIVSLLAEAGKNTSEAKEKIFKILELKKQAEIPFVKLKEKGIKELENEIKRMNYDLNALEQTRQRESKALEKHDENKNSLISELKEKLIGINIELIF